MNKQLFSTLLNDTSQLNEKTLAQLKEVIDEYPFFQMGRMLMVKNLHKLDHIRFNSDLKQSAAYISDRNKLYFLINDLTPPVQNNEVVEEIETVEEPIKEEATEKTSSKEPLKTETTSSSTANDYLQAEDELIDFKIPSIVFNNPNAELNTNSTGIEDIVLPSADLLDYERSTAPTYSLSDLEESNDDKSESDKSHSFSDWLQMMKNKKREAKKPKVENKKMDLIESFLNTSPKIIPNPNKPKKEIDLSEEQSKGSEDIMSETLANIFIKQGHNSKAILILEKLRLKYPEKNVYFARRISELKEN